MDFSEETVYIEDNKPNLKRKFEEIEREELQLQPESDLNKKCKKDCNKRKGNIAKSFIYGNYNGYYNNRNKGNPNHDLRLDLFDGLKKLFENAKILDIGCNSGFITSRIAKTYPINHITGFDIDKALIKRAKNYLNKCKRKLPHDNSLRTDNKYPYNIHYEHGDYILESDVLLEIQHQEYDIILCLSVTKWIHLNYEDAGLKQLFRRMFISLNSGGILILEPQPFHSYNKRKNLNEKIKNNYSKIQFYPRQFNDYLLSSSVGFVRMEILGVPNHKCEGFKRPIQVFYKA